MDIKELISEDRVFLDLNVSSKKELFEFIDGQALSMNIIKKKGDLLKSLLKREKECSTAFEDGFAIPHGKSKGILKPAIFVCRINNDLDWKSLDGSKVNIAIILAIPENEETNTLHLKVISGVARKLMRDDFRKNMKIATTEKEILNILSI